MLPKCFTLLSISADSPTDDVRILNGFDITPESARADVVSAARCGNHHTDNASGSSVHDLWCIDCGIWIGDVDDPEIAHVSRPLDAECRPSSGRETDDV